ncbi:MAG: hypothetical protein ACQESG_03930, partial [Nanobdellota archaeon]
QYDAGGGTCTACGVWRGVQGLLQSSNSISARLVKQNDVWSYYENFSEYHPPFDWMTSPNKTWETGKAILGNGDAQTLLYTNESPVFLSSNAPEDFSGGVNSSASSFRYTQNALFNDFMVSGTIIGKTFATRFNDSFTELDRTWRFVDNDDSSETSVSVNGSHLLLRAGGEDTWNGADEYASLYRTVEGDFEAIAKIDALENTHSWTKAGIMVKNSMHGTGSSQGYVFLVMTPGNGFSFQRDTNHDGFLDASTKNSVSNPPDWIKLQKVDKTFTASYSDDGNSWTALGSFTSDTALGVQDVGLSVTSHDSSQSAEAAFEKFELNQPSYIADYFNRLDNDYTRGTEQIGNWFIYDDQLRHTDNIYPGTRDEGLGPHVSFEDIPYDSYNISTRLYPGDDDTMGLLFRYQDENNYYRFRFDNSADFVRVEKIENGTRTVLSSNEASTLGFSENNWHTLRIVVNASSYMFYRNSNLIGAVTDSTFLSGGVAPYCWAMDDARFDNLIIEGKGQAIQTNATFGKQVQPGYLELDTAGDLNITCDLINVTTQEILSSKNAGRKTLGVKIPHPGDLNCTAESASTAYVTDIRTYDDTDDGWDKHNLTYGSHDTGVVHGYDGDGIFVEFGPQSYAGMVSGSWGTQFYIDDDMMQSLKAGNPLYLSFSFEYEELDDPLEEDVCILGRLSDTGSRVYLGEVTAPFSFRSLNAIWCKESGDHAQNITIDLTPLITHTGSYYLDFGALLEDTSWSNEGIRVTFDDVYLRFLESLNPGTYYFRKSFHIYPPLNYYSDPLLKLRADDSATVFINGLPVYQNDTPQEGMYWNNIVNLSMSHFREGDNLIAVRLNNSQTPKAEFDMELSINYTDPDRGKALLIMSDGVATYCANSALQGSGFYCNDCAGRPCCPDSTGALTRPCPDYPSLTDEAEQALGMACWANENHNISIYSVVFGDDAAGVHAMNMTAVECDNASNFYQSSNYSGISEIYKIIAQRMLEDFRGNFSRQSLVVGDDFGESRLNPNSYIEINYTPAYKPGHDDIFLSSNTLPFANTITNGSFHYSGRKKLLDAGVSSFSGDHWTNHVIVNNGTHNHTVFSLGNYGNVFKRLGDPYRVGIPVGKLKKNSTNYFFIHTGKNASERLNGSRDDRFFFSFVIDGLGISPTVNPNAHGCAWNVTYLDGSTAIIRIPDDYTGSKVCYYHNATYDVNDSIDQAAYSLFQQLDVEGKKRLAVKIDQNFLQVRTSTIGHVPSLWGPSLTEARVWK